MMALDFVANVKIAGSGLEDRKKQYYIKPAYYIKPDYYAPVINRGWIHKSKNLKPALYKSDC